MLKNVYTVFNPTNRFTFQTFLTISSDNFVFYLFTYAFSTEFTASNSFLYILPDYGLIEAETSRMGSYMTNYYLCFVVKFVGLNTILS
jgi:hypothetical protein